MIGKVLKVLLAVIGVAVLTVVIYLLYMTVTDYKPAKEVAVNITAEATGEVPTEKLLKVKTFNIGYGGLDKTQDFFMDGGKNSRSTSLKLTEQNLNLVLNELSDDTDFILLQEVDRDSTRSFYMDEYVFLDNSLEGYSSNFAYNYKVPWVPIPITEPHGKVEGGLATFTKYEIKDSMRYDLPGKEKWPKQLGLLDRCFVENRIPVENGKELILVNIHLSAYDKGGYIRAQQLDFLKEYLSKNRKEGNYVIVGGDYNHLLPGVDQAYFKNILPFPEWLNTIPEDFTPKGYSWAVDVKTPTCRSNEKSYVKGENYITTIDGFIVSDNVDVIKVEGVDLDFESSDHNPVNLEFKLKK